MDIYRILVVDDEEDLCEILQFNLEKAGFQVDIAYSGEEACTHQLEKYQLFLLDVMMGEMSGFKLASLIRKNPLLGATPIIFLTAKDTENDMLTGFSIGADDYISKPFSINEVIARVKAVLKRTQSAFGGQQLVQPDMQTLQTVAEAHNVETIGYKRLIINLSERTVYMGTQKLSLTKKEYEVLILLLQNMDKILSRETLHKQVWDDADTTDRAIDVTITRLRKKIAPYDKQVITKQGYGYGFSSREA